MFSLSIGCTSTTAKVERSDEEIAAAIKADNAKFEEFMNREDENGGSLRGLTDFAGTILNIFQWF
jgi:hypothetical protein